ncbi:MAG TPA: hypothetical protein VGG10_10245 [Rhizomicrobium sp.]|jgi:hypothetical protein
MGAFEHVISLLSFVYALAIAHLLTTVARLIGSRERVTFSWLHAYWMLNALIVLVVDWISYWDIRSVSAWTFGSILIVLTQSFVDYLQAALVCPEIPQEGAIDLVAFHETRSRRYIGAFVATTLSATLLNLYFGNAYNVSEYISQNAATIPLFLIALTAALVRSKWVQIAAPVLLLAVWSYYLFELQTALK